MTLVNEWPRFLKMRRMRRHGLDRLKSEWHTYVMSLRYALQMSFINVPCLFYDGVGEDDDDDDGFGDGDEDGH